MNIIPIEQIERSIFVIRGERVMISNDLANFYGVTTKQLNQQLKRNIGKFPEDFAFRLTKEEKENVIRNYPHLQNIKHSRTLPYVFTEHGALQLSSVLNSQQANEMSIMVIRTFVKIRKDAIDNKEVLSSLESIKLSLSELKESNADNNQGLLSAFECIDNIDERIDDLEERIDQANSSEPRKVIKGFNKDKK